MKYCKKCNKSKDLSLFYKDRQKSSGLSTYCKKCKDEMVLIWKNKNKEHVAIYQKSYKEKNKEKYKNYWVCYHIKNAEKKRKVSKSYYYNNIDLIKSKDRTKTKIKQKENIKKMSDSYIRKLIKEQFPLIQVTDEIIEIKKIQLSIHRETK